MADDFLFVCYFLLCTFLYSPFDNITICFSKLVKYIYFYQRYLIFFFYYNLDQLFFSFVRC